jgi:hypothetical protein
VTDAERINRIIGAAVFLCGCQPASKRSVSDDKRAVEREECLLPLDLLAGSEGIHPFRVGYYHSPYDGSSRNSMAKFLIRRCWNVKRKDLYYTLFYLILWGDKND